MLIPPTQNLTVAKELLDNNIFIPQGTRYGAHLAKIAMRAASLFDPDNGVNMHKATLAQQFIGSEGQVLAHYLNKGNLRGVLNWDPQNQDILGALTSENLSYLHETCALGASAPSTGDLGASAPYATIKEQVDMLRVSPLAMRLSDAFLEVVALSLIHI